MRRPTVSGCAAALPRLTLLAALAVWLLSVSALPVPAQAQAGGEEAGVQVIRVTAEKFEFKPEKIVLTKGKPVVLELISLDRVHGFRCPGLGIRVDVAPNKVTRVPLTPDKAGSFPFVCDVFCGDGHDEMSGVIEVKE
ncbi:cupredoxin domain-containing protein [Fundidesulfovibrio agrisoli]|uniref:cupredoxin domain-containing protein n=1 Tax=Fundidesulfovibrio agrisoli TaxID=2922717 RepID=UPI001FAC706F